MPNPAYTKRSDPVFKQPQSEINLKSGTPRLVSDTAEQATSKSKSKLESLPISNPYSVEVYREVATENREKK